MPKVKRYSLDECIREKKELVIHVKWIKTELATYEGRIKVLDNVIEKQQKEEHEKRNHHV